MKLWAKGFEISQAIKQFTVGRDRELDVWLAMHDILGSLAHTEMLQSINLLSADEFLTLRNELRVLYHEAQSGNFIIEDGVEDVHSQVELLLTRRLGDMGKKIQSGR